MTNISFGKMNVGELAEADVLEAKRSAETLLQHELPASGWCKAVAADRVERKYGIPSSLVLDLTRPSRRPKSIASHWKAMFHGARLALLDRWAKALEAELAVERAKAAAPDLDALAHDLEVVSRSLAAARTRVAKN